MGRDQFRFALPGGGEIVAPAGEITVALGENGSGLDAVGREIVRRIQRASRRIPAVAYLGRRRGLAPTMDVSENVFMGRELMRGSGLLQWSIDWTRTRDETSRLMGELGSDVSPVAGAQTLGELDRLIVELARAVARDAALVALDEPAAMLDGDEAERLRVALRAVAAKGAAVLVFSERPAEALEYADSVAVVRDREVVSGRRRAEWEGRSAAVRSSLLGEMFEHPELEAALGERAASADRVVPDAGARELLRVSGWTVQDSVDRSRVIVDDAGLAVQAGEIVGIAGLRDSGAEPLLLSVYGLSEGVKASGSAFIDGAAVDVSTVEKAIAAGLFLASMDPPRYRLRVIGGIAVPVSASSVSRFASMGLIDRDSDTDPGDGLGGRLLGAVRSAGRGGSVGDQLAGLVREFPSSERRVLLLGEPTRGVTDARRREVHEGIRAIAAAGKGVVVASTDLVELVQLCDRVLTMSGGRITGELRPASAPPISPAALGALLAPH
jgi:ABC-type sugar transport system ATPase subunit